MPILVIAEHDNSALKGATLNAVSAAAKLGPVTLLVAGAGCAAAGLLTSRLATRLKPMGPRLLRDSAALATSDGWSRSIPYPPL